MRGTYFRISYEYLEGDTGLIERIPAKPKQQLLGIIDTFIAAHQ